MNELKPLNTGKQHAATRDTEENQEKWILDYVLDSSLILDEFLMEFSVSPC